MAAPLDFLKQYLPKEYFDFGDDQQPDQSQVQGPQPDEGLGKPMSDEEKDMWMKKAFEGGAVKDLQGTAPEEYSAHAVSIPNNQTLAQRIQNKSNLTSASPTLLSRFAPKAQEVPKPADVPESDQSEDDTSMGDQARKPTSAPTAPKPTNQAEPTPDIDNSAALKDAQNKSNLNALNNAMLTAGLQVGAAASRTGKPADLTGAQLLAKQGNAPVEQFKAGQKQQTEDIKLQEAKMQLQDQKALNDATSSISQVSRDALRQMGIPVADTVTAKQLHDQGVNIGTVLSAHENAKLRAAMLGPVNEARQARIAQGDERIHNQIIGAIDKNPIVKQRVQQVQNLDNALAMLAAFPDGATPQQIADAQQLIVRNMGIQGQTGVAERAERYIHTAGMKGAGLLQFITGDPVKLAQDSQLMDYIRKQAHIERGNADEQMQKTISTLGQGHGSFYKKHPELYQDFKSKINSYKDLTSQQGQQPQTITVRRKTDGVTKTVPADLAAQLLNDPNYEQAQ